MYIKVLRVAQLSSFQLVKEVSWIKSVLFSAFSPYQANVTKFYQMAVGNGNHSLSFYRNQETLGAYGYISWYL